MSARFLVANTQAAKLIKPSEGPFHHPSPSAQSTAMVGVALGEPRNDVATTQTLPDCLCVMATVAYHAIRAMARSSSFSL
jgi:hypothetical protein